MSQRSRASRRERQQEHVHCASCFSRRCRARVEAGASCALGSCRLLCGALFHLCKEDEHLLLCPNVRVPCLNAAYGCPGQLTRHSRAAHLRLCPASVVSCSMEWLRWPVDETDPSCSLALQDSLLEEGARGQREALDVALALADQSELYGRLKMKTLYPELMEEGEEEEEVREEKKKEEEEEEEEEGESGGSTLSDAIKAAMESSSSPAEEETQQNRAEPAPANKRNLWDMMFSMDRGGCTAAQENLDKEAAEEKNPKAQREEAAAAAAAQDPVPADTSKMGQAPWQEGVLERLGQELTPQEYNMYVVHHGRMLLTFGQIQACTPREKDFVYGSLEPIPVQTLRSFKVPDSYHYRLRQYDTSAKPPSEPRGVDTSDLSSSQDDWYGDEAAAALLGYAEREVRGHKISESKGSDGLFVDQGTQTHWFRSAPFQRGTTVAQVMADRPLRLRLQLQTESVSGRHSRAACAFAFVCGHTFHRTEISTHVRNVHSEIHTALSGWFEQRCPLAYLGCTYSQRRFQPSTHKATVTYNQQLRTFNLRPTLASEATVCGAGAGAGAGAPQQDSLSSLPYEVLCHVASFLDALSLSQLALVSHLLRQVCSSQLQERGMVTLRWERDTHPLTGGGGGGGGGGARWKATPVWEFSLLFSPVDSWHMSDAPPMSAHLKVCPFYETHGGGGGGRSGRVPLPGMGDKQRCSQERVSLVNSLIGNRWKQ